MRWWWHLVATHTMFRDLRWPVICNLAVMAVWPVPLEWRLLALWGSATVAYVAAFALLMRIMRALRSIDATPNTGTLGLWLIALLGVVFNVTVVVGTYTGHDRDRGSPVTWFLAVFLSAYVLKAWTFFSVARRSTMGLR